MVSGCSFYSGAAIPSEEYDRDTTQQSVPDSLKKVDFLGKCGGMAIFNVIFFCYCQNTIQNMIRERAIVLAWMLCDVTGPRELLGNASWLHIHDQLESTQEKNTWSESPKWSQWSFKRDSELFDRLTMSIFRLLLAALSRDYHVSSKSWGPGWWCCFAILGRNQGAKILWKICRAQIWDECRPERLLLLERTGLGFWNIWKKT